VLSLIQPNVCYAYPDYELVLTFSGVTSVGLEAWIPSSGGEEVLGIECSCGHGVYRAEITIGSSGSPLCDAAGF
jgi:hypothetical protein